MVKRVIGNIPCLRLGLQDASLYHTKEAFEVDERGLVTPQAAKKVTDELGTGGYLPSYCHVKKGLKGWFLGAWVFYGALYGPDEITQPKFEYIKKQFSRIPGTRFNRREDVPEDSYLHDYAKFTAGIPVSLEKIAFLTGDKTERLLIIDVARASTHEMVGTA
jgi:hypothetical protein